MPGRKREMSRNHGTFDRLPRLVRRRESRRSEPPYEHLRTLTPGLGSTASSYRAKPGATTTFVPRIAHNYGRSTSLQKSRTQQSRRGRNPHCRSRRQAATSPSAETCSATATGMPESAGRPLPCAETAPLAGDRFCHCDSLEAGDRFGIAIVPIRLCASRGALSDSPSSTSRLAEWSDCCLATIAITRPTAPP